MLKRKNNIKLISFIVLLFSLFLICFLIINKSFYDGYKENINNVMSGVVDKVLDKYEDVKPSDIIELFNNPSNYEDNDVLKKYGLSFSDVSVLKGAYDNYKKSVYLNVCLLLLMLFIIIILLLLYFYNENKKIKKLSSYIDDIANKNYDLKLLENEEDSLSKLKNDLYKLMVMLKEKADLENEEKIKLKTSIEDISHQLKTPITSILINLDNLCDSDLDYNTREIFLNDAKTQISKMNFLIKSLLKLSRFDAGVIVFKKEKILVSKLLKNVIKNVSLLSELKEVDIKVIGNDDIYFYGDFAWEEEAITNVLKNALEHSLNGKTVKIFLEQNGVYTKISINNFGKVIDGYDLKNIFNRFYKGKNASYESIGIGLALSKSIIEKDGGYIKATSSEKKGTTFEIKYLKHL